MESCSLGTLLQIATRMLPKLHFNAIFGTQCIKKHEGVHREFYRSLLMVGGKSWGNFVSGISATLWEFVAMKVVRSSGYLLLVSLNISNLPTLVKSTPPCADIPALNNQTHSRLSDGRFRRNRNHSGIVSPLHLGRGAFF